MILKKMKVKNFRLLKNFELDFKDELSLVIGKNNCGKTSALVILDKMLNSSKVMWEDINLENDLKSSIFFLLIMFFNSMIFFAAINEINSNTIMLFSGFKSIMNF